MVKKVASYHSSSNYGAYANRTFQWWWLVVLMSGDNEDRDECS